MKTDYAAMDKYCDYARVRNYEKGVVRAEGVIDKVGKVGDIFTKPIQWTDRAAIGKIWNACQVQIERNDGHKIGTVENMQAAAVRGGYQTYAAELHKHGAFRAYAFR